MQGQGRGHETENLPSAGSEELHQFCERVAGEVGLERSGARSVEALLGTVRRLPLVWFQFAPVSRCRDAFARCTSPWAGDMLFAQLPADDGEAKEPEPRVLQQLTAALRASAGRYLCVIEGPLPHGTPSLARVVETALQVCSNARAVFCIGAAGAAGALAAAAYPTVVDALGAPAIHVSGAPPTAVAFAAALVTKLAGSALRAGTRAPKVLLLR